MIGYRSELKVKKLKNNKYVVLEDCIYFSKILKKEISIKKDFISDGCSLKIGNLQSNFLHSGILHDFIYKTKSFDRKVCDMIFYECMRWEGSGFIKAKVYYYGVRLFGGKYYGKN